MNISNFFGGLSATRSIFLFPLLLDKEINYKKHAKDSFTTEKLAAVLPVGENRIK
jgi:hypothetical protein